MKGKLVVYAIVGFFLGIFVGQAFGRYGLNAIAGAVIGIVFARLMHLERRIKQLVPMTRDSIKWGRSKNSPESLQIADY